MAVRQIRLSRGELFSLIDKIGLNPTVRQLTVEFESFPSHGFRLNTVVKFCKIGETWHIGHLGRIDITKDDLAADLGDSSLETSGVVAIHNQSLGICMILNMLSVGLTRLSHRSLRRCSTG